MERDVTGDASRAGSKVPPAGPRVALRLLCLLPFIMLPAQSAKSQSIGYVFDVNGEWVLEGRGGRLVQADSLPAGGVVRLRQAASFGETYIVIADLNGKPIINQRCREAAACGGPIPLPSAVAGKPSALSQIFAAVMSFWRKGKVEADPHIIRGNGSLEEAVVMLSGGKVDLSVPFKNKDAGTYLLEFIPKSNGRLRGLKEVVFDWEPGRRVTAAVPGFRPGLYEIRLRSKQDRGRLEPGEAAWVLVVPPGKDYEMTSAQFGRVAADTEQWEAEKLEESRRSFLRVYLGYLYAQKRK
jgi:hypothetical protein